MNRLNDLIIELHTRIDRNYSVFWVGDYKCFMDYFDMTFSDDGSLSRSGGPYWFLRKGMRLNEEDLLIGLIS